MAKKENELNIESMSTTGEIVKALLNSDGAAVHIDIKVDTDEPNTALLTVCATAGQFQHKYVVRPTKPFILKLIALFDQQNEKTEEISKAFENINGQTKDACNDIRERYELI